MHCKRMVNIVIKQYSPLLYKYIYVYVGVVYVGLGAAPCIGCS